MLCAGQIVIHHQGELSMFKVGSRILVHGCEIYTYDNSIFNLKIEKIPLLAGGVNLEGIFQKWQK